MKKSVLLTIAILSFSASAQAGAEKEKFSCSLTKFIENIDGTMQPRDRQTVAQKDLPATGAVTFEREVVDGKDDNQRKFRVKGKIYRGDKGRWVVEQKLFQILKEGEREGEEKPYASASPGKLTSLEIIRTFEQVHKGVPKTEFRLNCVVKVPTVETPVVSIANVDGGSGTKAELPGQDKVANVEIQVAGKFGKADTSLDRQIFSKIVDPEKPAPKTPKVPLVLAPKAEAPAKSGWKNVWPFRVWLNQESVAKKPNEPESPTHTPEVAPVVTYPDTGVSLKDLVAQDKSFYDRSKTPKVIPPPQPPYVAPPARVPVAGVRTPPAPKFVAPSTPIPPAVPLILAPQVLARVVEGETKKVSRAPASVPYRHNWKAQPVAESHPGFFGPPSPQKTK